MSDEPTGDGVFTQEQVDAAVKEALAKAKGESDAAFDNLWKEAKEAKAFAKKFGGLDPDEIRNQLNELTELKQKGKADDAGITGEQLDKIRLEVQQDLAKQYNPVSEENENLRMENRQLKLDNVVKGMMGKNGVRASRVDPLFRLAKDAFDLTDDGSVMLKDSPGRDVEAYIAETLADQYPEFYESSGSSGGGASKSAGGAGGSGVRTIKKGDNAALLANLDGVASGEVQVVE